jgi:hypothetical protein
LPVVAGDETLILVESALATDTNGMVVNSSPLVNVAPPKRSSDTVVLPT